MRIRARFVSSFILAVALIFVVLLPALAATYYVTYGSSPYYTPPTGGSSYGNGSTYQYNSGSYSTKYNSNYSTQYYYYTSRYSNGSSYYVPPKTSTPAPSNPKPSNPAPNNPAPTNPTPVEPKPTNPTTPSKGLTAMEQKMVTLVNQERTKAGLQQLKVDNTLVQLARKKSQDMIDKNYFGHTSPTYGSPFEMMKSAGVSYYTAGENLAGAGSVESAHASLMASSGHRANILNARYNHFGVGIAVGGPYGNMFTQLFIGK
ncbi:MAG TPA: hypothetical protein GXZ98_02100 [Firmicutes bacterium]|nr:hypothetical protein [Bacillota bacterium]